MNSRILCCAILGLSHLLQLSAYADDPAIVYDNTNESAATDGALTPGGFFPFSFYFPNEPMGDEITLTGSERVVTGFQVLLSSSLPTTVASLNITFRMNDAVLEHMGGYPFGPGTELWSTTLTDVQVDGLTTVDVAVPHVLVPDTFTWLVSADTALAGPATFDPPTFGTSDDFFWNWAADERFWIPMNFLDQPANFGARVLAVPEPTSVGLLLVCGLSILRRRRCRSE